MRALKELAGTAVCDSTGEIALAGSHRLRSTLASAPVPFEHAVQLSLLRSQIQVVSIIYNVYPVCAVFSHETDTKKATHVKILQRIHACHWCFVSVAAVRLQTPKALVIGPNDHEQGARVHKLCNHTANTTVKCIHTTARGINVG